jgi:hypothetical protein
MLCHSCGECLLE